MRAIACLLLGSALLQAQSSAPVFALREAVQLDGHLDESFWQQAHAIELTQQAPKPGETTLFRTMVRVAANSENVYFAFECKDLEPRQLAIHTMQRDGDVTADDFISIALDTYGDRRTGYFFRVNATKGGRLDGRNRGSLSNTSPRVSTPGREFRVQFSPTVSTG